jgi:MFS family permease
MLASSLGFLCYSLPVEFFIFSYYGALAVPLVLADTDRKQLNAWLELDSPRGRAIATIKLAVFLDMIGVGIFVPMLQYYWKELGKQRQTPRATIAENPCFLACERFPSRLTMGRAISGKHWDAGVRTELMGLVSSAYNMSQIMSGIVLGYVSDHLLGRKNVLLLRHRFSKGLNIVTLHRVYARAMNFENLCSSFGGSAVSYALAGAAYQAHILKSPVSSDSMSHKV